MLYYLFRWLDETFDLPGAGVFVYISFRAIGSTALALILTIWAGKRIIRALQRWQVREPIRKLGLPGESRKEGTPTMGGLMIASATLISALLFARLENVYVQVVLISILIMAFIGFVDDYIKVFKRQKAGMKAFSKLFGQGLLGLLVGLVLAFHPDVRIRLFYDRLEEIPPNIPANQIRTVPKEDRIVYYRDIRQFSTTLPFLKNQTFQYEWIARWFHLPEEWTWVVFVLIAILINTALSNAVNLTDGLDGLAAGTSAIALSTLALFAYVSGHMILSDYLNIMYIPGAGELVIVIGALVGATVGFLWYNAYPAQIFMGDTGSMMLGSVIGVLALILRKELLLPLLCGIFFIEALSVLLQIGYFKWTRWRTGVGRRIFRMAPLHHHFQLKGWHENQVVVRFWLTGGLLALATLVLLKLR